MSSTGLPLSVLSPLPPEGRTYEIVDMLTPSQAVDLFLGDLAGKSKSRKGRTEDSYRRVLDKFTDSLGPRIDVTEIRADHIRQFFSGYRHLSPNTYSTYDAYLRSFFAWLRLARRIRVNPMEEIPKPKRVNPMDLDVTTVDKGDVPRLLEACETTAERLAVNLALYTGARRSALNTLRLSDYNQATGKLLFREKGGKTVARAIADELRDVLDQAIETGVYKSPDDYLIPSEGPLARDGERDDRHIWRMVKRVGARAGVPVHVHALRAAFATFYLETHPGNLVGLQELMGHASSEVTRVYLRKLDRQKQMETVRDLSWRSVVPNEYAGVSSISGVDR